MVMKKGIFINASIINHLWFFYISISLFEDLYKQSLIILFFIITYNLRHIFISRENRILKKGRQLLYITFILMYLNLITICVAYIYNYNILLHWSTFSGIILYLFMISIYFELIFGGKYLKSEQEKGRE
jgi:heme A synthase